MPAVVRIKPAMIIFCFSQVSFTALYTLSTSAGDVSIERLVELFLELVEEFCVFTRTLDLRQHGPQPGRKFFSSPVTLVNGVVIVTSGLQRHVRRSHGSP